MSEITDFESILLDALDSISEAFVIYDKEGYLVTCNEKFRTLYDYTLEEACTGVHYTILGKLDIAHGNVVVGDEDGTGEAYIARKKKYRENLTGSFIVHLSDGRWLKTTDRRLSNGGFVSIQSDITEEKRNEEFLYEAKQLAEVANRAKSEFMANMSHELRTPLNAIIGFSSLLASEIYGPHTDPRYKEYAEDIEGAGDHLLLLINEILDLAKIETGSVALNERATNIWQLSKSCKSMICSRANERNVKVDISVQPPSLALNADPIRLKQILVNLASNAVKFSHPNGKISIDWAEERNRITLTVKDRGVGIEPEFIPHLYEPFRRSQIAQDLQHEGTGLGLTLVKKFSDAHNATLQVDSSPGFGTTFKLLFPESRTLQAS